MYHLLCCCPGPATLCCKELLLGEEWTDSQGSGKRGEWKDIQDKDVMWKPKVVFEDGRTYEGQWKGKLRHGHGKELSRYGDFVYEGMFKNDQYHGDGVMTWSNGAKYIGQFLANEKHGYGEETYSTGESFKGNFRHGRVHGKGQYYFVDDTSLKGDWVDGKLLNELATFTESTWPALSS